ncbi:MAG: hypothetical protein ACE5E5_13260, partial [Phycisphaerae bacterium]
MVKRIEQKKVAVSALVAALMAAPAVAVIPDLSVSVSGGPTFQAGDAIMVTLDVANIDPVDAINGVQALLHYDPSLVTLSSIVPTTDISGDGDPSSPPGICAIDSVTSCATDLDCTVAGGGVCIKADDWAEAILDDEQVCSGGTNNGVVCTDGVACTAGGGTCVNSGNLTYAVVINSAGVATSATHTVATLTFTAIGLGTTSFTFRADGLTIKTKLTRESDNGAIVPNKTDSTSITLTCDDGNLCTDDSLVSGLCVHTNNTAPCDDGSACTTNDTCSAGVCVGGAPPNCDDGNVCTDDTCDPATGCVNTNNVAACDDGSACTTNDTC